MSRELIENLRDYADIAEAGEKSHWAKAMREAAEYIMADLDKPLPETVAWMKKHENGVVIFSLNPAEESDFTPLYAEPPTTVSKPLKYNEIYLGAKENKASMYSFLLGVQFAEEKHGIRGRE
jgi:hypothetical protein